MGKTGLASGRTGGKVSARPGQGCIASGGECVHCGDGMLHIDGSEHRWFQDERKHDLIVILDDATSEIYYAQLAEEETTATVMAGCGQ